SLTQQGEYMSPKATKKRPKSKPRAKAKTASQRAQALMSREARAAYGDIQKGVRSLEKSIGEIQRGLRQAEQKVEADARARIRSMRKESRVQLSLLKAKQREAADALRRLRAAAGGSWDDIKSSIDSVVADVRATAIAVAERFRTALGG